MQAAFPQSEVLWISVCPSAAALHTFRGTQSRHVDYTETFSLPRCFFPIFDQIIDMERKCRRCRGDYFPLPFANRLKIENMPQWRRENVDDYNEDVQLPGSFQNLNN